MRVIEITSKTDKSGNLKIEYQLNESDRDVRILILLEEEYTDADEEKAWIKSLSENPAFEFLNDPAEDIYSLNDGEPLND